MRFLGRYKSDAEALISLSTMDREEEDKTHWTRWSIYFFRIVDCEDAYHLASADDAESLDIGGVVGGSATKASLAACRAGFYGEKHGVERSVGDSKKLALSASMRLGRAVCMAYSIKDVLCINAHLGTW